MLLNLSSVLGAANTNVPSVWKSRDLKDVFIRKSIRHEKQEWEDKLSMQDWRRPLVEHNFVDVTDLLVLSCTGTCEIAFLGCSVWRSGERLDLQILFSGTLLGACRSRNWRLNCLLWKRGLSQLVLFFTFPRLLKSSIHLKTVVCAGGVFWHPSVKVLAGGCYGLRLIVPNYTLNFSWTVNPEISIFWFRCMSNRCSQLC